MKQYRVWRFPFNKSCIYDIIEEMVGGDFHEGPCPQNPHKQGFSTTFAVENVVPSESIWTIVFSAVYPNGKMCGKLLP